MTAPAVSVTTAREVPLGGPRAMTVRRTLPERRRTTVGAWCFADHYGPDPVAHTGGMDVAPHPHTGLQTVSWLFEGEIEHRDSHGVVAVVRPGEVNLMTGGHGICHSEVSTPETDTLHGVQLWIVLPDAHRDAPRRFDHHVPEPVALDGGEMRVFLGSLGGSTSPVPTFTPLLGAEITIEKNTRITLEVDPRFEHAVLVDTGRVDLSGTSDRAGEATSLSRADLGHLDTGTRSITIATALVPARVILLGGEPFEEDIVMWWNFIGRDHDEIVEYRDAWEREDRRFGRVEGYRGPVDRLPAPPLPTARLRPRKARPA